MLNTLTDTPRVFYPLSGHPLTQLTNTINHHRRTVERRSAGLAPGVLDVTPRPLGFIQDLWQWVKQPDDGIRFASWEITAVGTIWVGKLSRVLQNSDHSDIRAGQ